MQELGADISKIAVMPQSTEDVLTLLSATEEMRRCYADRPVLTMSMAGTGDSKPHVWGSLWLSTYIWCGGKSICTGTD